MTDRRSIQEAVPTHSAVSQGVWNLLARADYVSLTTFRKDGTPVATPVWIAPDGDRLLVWTNPAAGKVKRIRRNGAVTVAPCTVRGELLGRPIPARAAVLPETEVPVVRRALVAKYGWTARLTFLPQHLVAAIGRPHPAGVLEITVDGDPGAGDVPSGIIGQPPAL